MDKKHELYVKSPVYFGYASLAMLGVIVFLSQFRVPDGVIYFIFFLGFACTIGGLMAVGMKEGQSKADRRYCLAGTVICLLMLVVYLVIIWFYATIAYPLMQMLSGK